MVSSGETGLGTVISSPGIIFCSQSSAWEWGGMGWGAKGGRGIGVFSECQNYN